ncbi:MAG TPA: HlyD family efflux transporter periplasmic adaptor subunit [Sphingomicrobium sp.]|nr:HlyD family efflux transporter periplasmic adaptor subunit [Sphingomicrobium sp.]
MSTSSGVVGGLKVQQGQFVRAGEPLFWVQSFSSPQANLDTNLVLKQAILAQRAELQIQLGMTNKDEARNSDEYLSKLNTLNEVLRHLFDEQNIQIEHRTLTTAAVDSARGAFDRGFISKIEWQRRQESLLESKKDLVETRSKIVLLKSQIRNLQFERLDQQAALTDVKSKLRSAIAKLDSEDAVRRENISYTVTAPSSGILADISIRNGDAILPGQIQFTILNDHSPVIGEIYIRAHGGVHIRPGQEVRIAFDALPVAIYGRLEGKIRQVASVPTSANLLPKYLDSNEPYYRAEAIIKQPSGETSRRIRLAPGMMFTGEIVIDRAPVWKRLVQLIIRDAHEAQ